MALSSLWASSAGSDGSRGDIICERQARVRPEICRLRRSIGSPGRPGHWWASSQLFLTTRACLNPQSPLARADTTRGYVTSAERGSLGRCLTSVVSTTRPCPGPRRVLPPALPRAGCHSMLPRSSTICACMTRLTAMPRLHVRGRGPESPESPASPCICRSQRLTEPPRCHHPANADPPGHPAAMPSRGRGFSCLLPAVALCHEMPSPPDHVCIRGSDMHKVTPG